MASSDWLEMAIQTCCREGNLEAACAYSSELIVVLKERVERLSERVEELEGFPHGEVVKLEGVAGELEADVERLENENDMMKARIERAISALQGRPDPTAALLVSHQRPRSDASGETPTTAYDGAGRRPRSDAVGVSDTLADIGDP